MKRLTIFIFAVSLLASCTKQYILKQPRTNTDVRIEIYAAEWCYICKKETEFLDKLGFKYEVHWIDKDEKKEQELIKISGQVLVPVTIITARGRKYIKDGFDISNPYDLLVLE